MTGEEGEQEMANNIGREEVEKKIGAGATAVEALPPLYYEDAHLPGALNLPLDEVEALAPTLLPDKEAEIIVYCSNSSCSNSKIAAEQLERLGYTNVHKYGAGKQDWVEAGLPTESGAAAETV
jgi:rhodanese-related sulfurtransferase